MPLLTNRVKNNVKFVFAEGGTLWYQCYDGFEFPIPPEDQGNAQGNPPRFMATDKGIYFMRWIRKAME